MNKQQSRMFAIGCTAAATIVFLALTVDTHMKVGKLTNFDQYTEAADRGRDVWHDYNCINCHTLMGEGAYYAPDLTKIAQQRGAPYLEAFLKDPSKFYDEQKYRRLMPNMGLKDQEIKDVIAFLDWVSKIDTNNWPPRPLLVAGATIPGMDLQRSTAGDGSAGAAGSVDGGNAGDDAKNLVLGQQVFKTTCSACHSIAPGVNMVGPTLAGVKERADKLLASGEYKGQAKDAKGYIHESIVHPSAYLVPGAAYSSGGQSLMPTGYDKSLKPEQVDQLVDYLVSLK